MKDTATSKIKQILAIIGMSVLLFTAALTMSAEIANAGSATATRTLPAEPVPAGDFFTVSIEVSDCTAGYVNETLPEGFLYLGSGTIHHEELSYDGETNTVKFGFIGDSSFTYNVRAPETEGTYTFSGILVDIISGNEYEVGGDTEIEVEEAEEEAEPTATRTLPEEPVSADESFTIEIEASHYGFFGDVVETLPEGFVYEDSTLDPGRVKVEDNTVEFSLGGEHSFTYTVEAPDTEGTYTFSGILIDEYKNEYDIGGNTEIVVGEGGVGVTIGTLNITAWNPVEATVNNAEGESRTFNISINQTVNISWQINGTEVQTNESVTEAAYTNTSAVVGTWNVSAIATNTTTGLSDMHTWIWSVTLTSTVTPTPTPAVNITSTPTPSPSVTPTPTSKPSPGPTSTHTPAPPGFEAGFAFAAIFAVTYLFLQGKKRDGKE